MDRAILKFSLGQDRLLSVAHLGFFQIPQNQERVKIVRISNEDEWSQTSAGRALNRLPPLGPRDAGFNQEDLRLIDGLLTAVLGQHLAGSQDPRG